MSASIVDFSGCAATVARSPRAICLYSNTAVAGTRHVAGIGEIAFDLAPCSRLVFERDRENLYDPWAVRVLDQRRNRLGFVSCECNEVVARLMDGGKHVFGQLEDVSQIENWTRVQMGVYLDD